MLFKRIKVWVQEDITLLVNQLLDVIAWSIRQGD